MENERKQYIRFHALFIKKMIDDYKNMKITDVQFLNSIQNHAELIIKEL